MVTRAARAGGLPRSSERCWNLHHRPQADGGDDIVGIGELSSSIDPVEDFYTSAYGP